MVPEQTNLLNYTRLELKNLMIHLGFKAYHGDQIFKWIHGNGIIDFNQMTNLSKNLRDLLLNNYQILLPNVINSSISNDGTNKWLVAVAGKSIVETVLIPQAGRNTLCISSQAGCTLNCDFCHTGKQGFSTNLTTAEIIGQLWLAKFKFNHNITNVVMMGMGEPLLNFSAVHPALTMMRDEMGYHLPRKRVTVSTAGVVPMIYKLADSSEVSLAISLHAPTDDLRNILVPLNKKYPIKELIEACKYFVKVQDFSKSRITIEYVMLQGVNDSILHAKQLGKLLQQIPCKINLIPFNPFNGANYKTSSLDDIKKFSQTLMQAGFIVTIRLTRGQDIEAACGQLAGKIQDRTKRNARFIQTIAH